MPAAGGRIQRGFLVLVVCVVLILARVLFSTKLEAETAASASIIYDCGWSNFRSDHLQNVAMESYEHIDRFWLLFVPSKVRRQRASFPEYKSARDHDLTSTLYTIGNGRYSRFETVT